MCRLGATTLAPSSWRWRPPSQSPGSCLNFGESWRQWACLRASSRATVSATACPRQQLRWESKIRPSRPWVAGTAQLPAVYTDTKESVSRNVEDTGRHPQPGHYQAAAQPMLGHRPQTVTAVMSVMCVRGWLCCTRCTVGIQTT